TSALAKDNVSSAKLSGRAVYQFPFQHEQLRQSGGGGGSGGGGSGGGSKGGLGGSGSGGGGSGGSG
ncbi:hypothetical protein NPIL_175962, partial [Nephila pilipes]